MPECWSALGSYRVVKVARPIPAQELAAAPTPGPRFAGLDQRTAEQHAIDRLLAAWRRIVEENLFVR